LLFVAGGTGIAPLRSMLWSALDRLQPPAIDVIYSARTDSELAFAGEFTRLHRDGLIRYAPTVTRRATTTWRGRRGRIDRDLLQDVLRPRAVCLLCGSSSFIEDLSGILRTLGVRAGNIRRELY
jgi:ferredoxin-NADP reductase